MDCLYLVQHGVPFDVAFSLPSGERSAFVIALGELNGHRFDWDRLEWAIDERSHREAYYVETSA